MPEVGSFDGRDAELRRQAAEMLVEEFREHWPDAWPTLDAAEAEVDDALTAGKVAFAAIAEDHRLLGWAGGQAQAGYGGHVWEVHPVVVRREAQRQGIGRALVERLEEEVRRRGGLTLCLGTDDEAGLTSLGGIDLYPGVLEKLSRIANLRGHPMGFYQRLGFEVTGVVPDANGFGRPDILMAKRVGVPPIRPT